MVQGFKKKIITRLQDLGVLSSNATTKQPACQHFFLFSSALIKL